MKTTLRLRLPRLAELQPDSEIAFALVEGDRARRSGLLPLRKLAEAVPPQPVVAILHPADANLAEVTVPPLASHQMAAGVSSALEPLLLGDTSGLAIAHGPRKADGRVVVAWADRRALMRAWEILVEHRLPAKALVPAPLALPLPAQGIVLAHQDHHLLARRADGSGSTLALDPLLADDELDEAGRLWLDQLLAEQPAVTWVDPRPAWYPVWAQQLASGEVLAPPELTAPLGAEAIWVGPLPDWSLALPALRPKRLQGSAWHRPLQWLAAATAIWLVGLNLHAMQLRQEASSLETGMTERVRQALPQLPVVLDPLRQATQQRDALRSAGGSSNDHDFLPLALAAAQLLPDDAQSLRGLVYDNGMLTLDLRGSAAADLDALDTTLLTRAQELGLQVADTEGGLTIEPQGNSDRNANGAVSIEPGRATSRRMQDLTGGNR